MNRIAIAVIPSGARDLAVVLVDPNACESLAVYATWDDEQRKRNRDLYLILQLPFQNFPGQLRVRFSLGQLHHLTFEEI